MTAMAIRDMVEEMVAYAEELNKKMEERLWSRKFY
jgi:PTS system cellobiose-specific IIA component